jgi:hypothetical protein
MPVDNFNATVAADAADALGLDNAGNNLISWANLSSAVTLDSNVATVSYATGSAFAFYANSILVTNLIRESTGQPIASEINSSATINAISIQANFFSTGAQQNFWARLVSDATGSPVGTRAGAVGLFTGTPTWFSITNGTIFGGAATTADVRGTGFGCYISIDGGASGTETISLDAVRFVIDWTNGTESTARPRRQLIRLPDGRLAAARARIR